MVEISGAEEGEEEDITGAVAETCTEETTGTVTPELAAWWRAAQRRFLSLSAGPQWRGRGGEELEEEEESEE